MELFDWMETMKIYITRFFLRRLLLGVPAFFLVGAPIVRAQGPVQTFGVIQHDVSPPLWSMQPILSTEEPREVEQAMNPPRIGPTVEDPVLQRDILRRPLSSVSVAQPFQFDGVGNQFSIPPDTNGAAGATQFVQWVNFAFSIFDKTTGALLWGPANGSSLWQNFGGPCETDNNGDPIAEYDKAAGRWVMLQFAMKNGPPNYECVAVSVTSDATGRGTAISLVRSRVRSTIPSWVSGQMVITFPSIFRAGLVPLTVSPC